MGDAEEVVSRRLIAQARAANNDNDGQDTAKAQHRKALRRQIRDDIPVVLQCLEAAKFPGGTLIHVVVDDEPNNDPGALLKEMVSGVVKTLMGHLTGDPARDEEPATQQFAAWSICVVDSSQSRVRMYLLSDGRITVGSEPVNLNDLGGRRLEAYASGLAELKKQLGG